MARALSRVMGPVIRPRLIASMQDQVRCAIHTLVLFFRIRHCAHGGVWLTVWRNGEDRFEERLPGEGYTRSLRRGCDCGVLDGADEEVCFQLPTFIEYRRQRPWVKSLWSNGEIAGAGRLHPLARGHGCRPGVSVRRSERPS